jgi:hypothetical protein
VVRRKIAQKSVLILTRQRVIEVNEIWPQFKKREQFSIRSYFLSGLEVGCITRLPGLSWIDVQTDFGGLTITPAMSNRYPWDDFLFGMTPSVYAKVKTFLSNFAYVDIPSMYSKPEILAIPPRVLKLPLSSGEHFVDLYNTADRMMTNMPCPVSITKCLTCGVHPISIEQDLILTTSRIWAYAAPVNNPWFCSAIFGMKYEIIFWSALKSKYFLGHKISGTLKYAETWYTRIFGCFNCSWCIPSSARSIFKLAFDFGSRKGFPVEVINAKDRVKCGYLEAPQMNRFRKSMALLQGLEVGKKVAAPEYVEMIVSEMDGGVLKGGK